MKNKYAKEQSEEASETTTAAEVTRQRVQDETKVVAKHGNDVPMKRPGEPVEVAPCYLFLASDDAS
jgi:NAD(P)-dependent dehydrogenase (short-subunit alcohol dehydrogenase family)